MASWMPLRVGPPFGASPPERGNSTPIFTTVPPALEEDELQAEPTIATRATSGSSLTLICRILRPRRKCRHRPPGRPLSRRPPLAPGSPTVGRHGLASPLQALCGSVLNAGDCASGIVATCVVSFGGQGYGLVRTIRIVFTSPLSGQKTGAPSGTADCGVR